MLVRTVCDSPSHTNCLCLGCDGSVVVLSKESILIYSPRFHYSLDLDNWWITLSKKSVIDIVGASPKPVNVVEWFRDFHGYSGDFKQLCFLQVRSAKNAFVIGSAPLLGALLTNGSLLLFGRDIPSIGVFEHELFQLKLYGYEVIFDFTTIYATWCLEKQTSSHIGVFALHADISNASIVICVGGGSRLSLWSIAMRNNELICQVITSTTMQLTINSEITALQITTVNDTSICIRVGTSCGSLHLCQVTKSSGDIEEDSLSLGSTMVSCFREDGRFHVISGNKIHVSTGSSVYTLLSFKYPVSGWAGLFDFNNRSSSCELVQLCSTMDGSYHVWNGSNPALGVSVTSRDVNVACGQAADPLINLSGDSNGNGKSSLFGLVADPLGLVLVSAVKLNPVHDNSRETQLNKNVTRSRIQVKWSPSPFVNDDTIGSVASVASLLSHVLNRTTELSSSKERGSDGVSLFSLAMLFCQLAVKSSVEPKDLAAYISGGKPGGISTSSTSSVKQSRVDSHAAADADTSDSEVEDVVAPAAKKTRNTQHYVRSASNVGSSATIKIDSEAQVSSITQQQQQEELRRALNRTSKGHNVAVEATIHRLLEAATVVAATLKPVDGAVYGVCAASVPLQNDSLYSLPSDPHLLRKKIVLWQSLHVVTVALHHSCDLPLTVLWKSVVLALKQSIVTADCILKLNRWMQRGPSDSFVDSTLLRRLEVLRVVLSDVQTSTTLCASVLSKIKEWHRIRTGTEFSAATLVNQCSEQCFICGATVPFDPQSFEVAQCTTCGVQSERCCHSIQMIHQPEVQHKLLRCSCCKAVMIQGQADDAMCLYCSVAMYAFV